MVALAGPERRGVPRLLAHGDERRRPAAEPPRRPALSERSPLSGYASIGRDELQALLIVTQRVDRDHGTGYHARVVDYVKRFQREQLMTAAAVTDVKGDRSKRPADQDDPDLYLRVVERRADGIVVRGAKAHTSGSRGRERARRDPAARDARGRRRLRRVVRDPGRHARHQARLPRLLGREPGRVRGAGLEPRRPDGVVHDLRRRLRSLGARLPVRRVGVRRRRSRTRSRTSTGRATSAPTSASCGCSSAPRSSWRS